MSLEKLRNIGISAHIDSGKTTLSERILYYTGRIHKIEEVRGDGDGATMDHMELERERGITITSAATSVEYQGHPINLIDTPGYSDFIGGMIGAIAAVDCAVVCVNAHTGIQLNTRRAMQEAESAGIARVLVITKMDDPQANFSDLLESCREIWGSAVPLQVPIGQGESLTGTVCTIDLPSEARGAVMNLAHAHEQLVEKLVETDETLMEQYFEGVMPDRETLMRLLREGIANGTVVPVFCVAST